MEKTSSSFLSLDERISRGSRARTLLADETFQAAVLEVENVLTKQILRSKFEDTEAREGFFAEYHGVKAVIARLSRWVEDGQMAEKEQQLNED